MDINSILKEWDVDSSIDKAFIGDEVLRIIKLHSKYYKKLAYVREAINKLESKKDELYKERVEYYRGVGEEVYEVKIIKTDLQVYLKSDPVLKPYIEKLRVLYDLKQTLIDIISFIRDMQFQIKTYVDWKKFSDGEY